MNNLNNINSMNSMNNYNSMNQMNPLPPNGNMSNINAINRMNRMSHLPMLNPINDLSDLPDHHDIPDIQKMHDLHEYGKIPEPMPFDPNVIPQQQMPFNFDNIQVYDVTQQYSFFSQDQPQQQVNHVQQIPITLNQTRPLQTSIFPQYIDIPVDRIYDITHERIKQITPQHQSMFPSQMNQSSFQPINPIQQSSSLQPIHGMNSMNQMSQSQRNSLVNKQIGTSQKVDISENQSLNKSDGGYPSSSSNHQWNLSGMHDQHTTPQKGSNQQSSNGKSTYNLMFKPIEPDTSFQSPNQHLYQNYPYQQKYNPNDYN